MKVFISQPMNGKTGEEILITRAEAIEQVRRMNEDESLEIINSFMEGYKPEGKRKALKVLTKALEMMADADLVVFTPGWREARGCRIEYECARAYDIPRLYIPK